MLEDRPVTGRLDSWKEIAAYLHRDVRTVIRWEQEKALPVHRIPGGQRQAVFAYIHEIDAWLVSQPTNGNHSASPTTAEATEPATVPPVPGSSGNDLYAGAERRSAPRRALHFHTWKLVGAAACLLALIWITIAVLVRPRTAAPIRLFSLHQLTDGGRSKGYALTDGTTLYFAVAEGARALLGATPMNGGSIRPIETPFANAALQDLSNDGKRLLIISFDGIVPQGPLWTIPVEGGIPTRVGDVQCFYARWAPDNKRIACSHKTEIVVLNADGSKAHTFASFSMPVRQIIWSPGGDRLRYILDDTDAHTYSQWEVGFTPDGKATEAHELSLGPRCCLDWAWTHDGKTFFYVTYDEQLKSHLMAQSGGSSSATELPVNGTIANVTPSRTAKVLYLSIVAGSGRNELLKFNAERATFETFHPGLAADYIAFSPDGRWMTYTSTGGGSLWRSRSDGSQPLQLAPASWEVQVSSWSPDGQRIAFMGKKPGKPYRIYLTDRDGGVPQEASEGDDNQGGPSWSPDGKTIVYGNVFCELTQNCWIRRLNLATRTTETVPGSNGFRTARWSPDGKYIAALRFQARELMLFDLKKRNWRMRAKSVAGDNIYWTSDSQFVYVDSPRDTRPVVERIRIRDGRRTTIVSLDLLQNVPGALDTWFGLTPDNSPILSHIYSVSEIYELQWTDH
ncbi:MAG TPA: hypothetical protein VF532_20460 [Candidatus Angelobacter sp.]